MSKYNFFFKSRTRERTLELKRTSEVIWKTLATSSLAPRPAQSAWELVRKTESHHPRRLAGTWKFLSNSSPHHILQLALKGHRWAWGYTGVSGRVWVRSHAFHLGSLCFLLYLCNIISWTENAHYTHPGR